MTRKLKVYGWQGWRQECRPAKNGSRATREVVAAHSIAEVMRVANQKRSELFCLTLSANPTECRTALARPGVVFWRPIDGTKHELQPAAK